MPDVKGGRGTSGGIWRRKDGAEFLRMRLEEGALEYEKGENIQAQKTDHEAGA